jgi:hypothetical protein
LFEDSLLSIRIHIGAEMVVTEMKLFNIRVFDRCGVGVETGGFGNGLGSNNTANTRKMLIQYYSI